MFASLPPAVLPGPFFPVPVDSVSLSHLIPQVTSFVTPALYCVAYPPLCDTSTRLPFTSPPFLFVRTAGRLAPDMFMSLLRCITRPADAQSVIDAVPHPAATPAALPRSCHLALLSLGVVTQHTLAPAPAPATRSRCRLSFFLLLS